MRITKTKALLLMIGILVIAVVTAISIFYSLGADLRQEVSMTKSTAAVETVREKFMELATPIQRDLALLSQWGASGLIDFGDTASLNGKLIPLINSQPMVTSLIVADTDGREYFLLKDGASWVTRLAGPYRPDMTVSVSRLDKTGHLEETRQAERTFDPRTRNWFAGALQLETDAPFFWTEPYTFKTLGRLGITAATRWKGDERTGKITIAAMDILLETLRQYLAELKVSPGSKIVLIRNDGMVVTPGMISSGDATIEFVDLNGLPNGLSKDALAVWTDLRQRQTTPHAFVSSGKRWWASFQPLQPESPKTWIGVLIPEADLVNHMQRWWVPYAVKFGSVMLFLVLFSGLVVWQYSRRHGTASDQKPGQQTIAALIEAGESPTVEFKSTIRTNLKNGKKDKAIELAWLKSVTAFMNSEGGTLLVGITDDGTPTGIDADEFENEDKCLLHVKNLIHEHIGSEFAGNIDCRLHPVQGRTVVSLTCRKSEAPVFLKIGKNEDFFIRSGPSSTKLSMSQMVAYLEQRK